MGTPYATTPSTGRGTGSPGTGRRSSPGWNDTSSPPPTGRSTWSAWAARSRTPPPPDGKKGGADMAITTQTMTDEQRKSVALEYLKAFDHGGTTETRRSLLERCADDDQVH